MPEVKLIDFTGAGRADWQWHAADMLIFTKSTRLTMGPGLMDRIKNMSLQEKREELQYMATTIPSSWEFADLTFLISGVSRAAAQQITRTRTASYAMQSQRVNDISDAQITNPFPPGDALHAHFETACARAKDFYGVFIAYGAEPGDARGIMPLNTQCNLVVKYNLRTFVELVRKRSSLRVQGEYSEIVRDMKCLVLKTWPWAAPFFESPHAQALALLEEAAKETGMTTGSGAGWKIAKAMDLIRES